MIRRCPAHQVLILCVVGYLLERRLIRHLPSPVIEHQEIDRLWEGGVTFGLAIERQTPKIESRRVAVVNLAPEMVVLAKAIDAPIEVAEDHERHKLPCRLVDPRLKRGALCRQGDAVGSGRVIEAAAMAPRLEMNAEQPKQLPVLLHEDLGAPTDWAAICDMDNTEARDITLADGIEDAAADGEPGIDAIRALLGIGVYGLAGDEVLDVAP